MDKKKHALSGERVFVVTVGTLLGEDISVEGVFTTFEEAKERKDLIEGLNPSYRAWIDNFFLNE